MTGRLYTLEARDRTGVFLGMSVIECALVGAGFLLAITARLAGAPVVASVAVLALATSLAKLRIAGRPVREWIPLLAGWAATRITGRRSWRAPLPLFPASGSTAALPPVLRGVDVVELPWRGRTLAAVRDRCAGRLTAVLTVDGGQFACEDPPAQDALVAAWGDVLGSSAVNNSPVVQIGWSDVASPVTLAEHLAWVDCELADAVEPVGELSPYRELVDELTGEAVAHRTVVWLTVAGAAVPGGGKPLDRAAAQLPAAVDDLVAALDSAGLTPDDPLPAAGLWRLLRHRIAPDDAVSLDDTSPSRGTLARRLGLVDGHNGGPMAMSTTWSEVRIDGCFHRVWWVESWPRRPVPGDWLSGFLASGEKRTMTVLHRPLDPERSQRRIESQLVKLAAHRVRKEERDRRVTEADQRTEQAVRDLETELASGYAELLYLGLVTVSASTLDELDDAARRVEQTARAHGIGLRVLHGRQDVAWAASLPFGLAEPGLLEVAGV